MLRDRDAARVYPADTCENVPNVPDVHRTEPLSTPRNNGLWLSRRYNRAIRAHSGCLQPGR